MAYMPESVQRILSVLPREYIKDVDEVRIRENQPVEITVKTKIYFLSPEGHLIRGPEGAYRATRDDCRTFLNIITDHSFYTLEDEIRSGYITLKGGHRVGLAGKVITEQNRVQTLKYISGFNFRVAKAVKGAADPVLPHLYEHQTGKFHNTLVVSPPMCGKTTLLRDLARMISTGTKDYHLPSQKVAIVDERSELAGAFHGVPQHDVGIRTDVMDGCPKAEGMMMMIRSMSPEVLVVDEIGSMQDVEAILEAVYTGVTVIASAHGRVLPDLQKRPSFTRLMVQKIFTRYVLLSKREGMGTVETILDADFRPVLKEQLKCLS
jgi:stage III sporulation protein AA